MIPLNETERSIMRVVAKYQRMYTNSPTRDELAKELGCHKDSLRYAMDELVKKGYLEIAYGPVGVSTREMIVVLYLE